MLGCLLISLAALSTPAFGQLGPLVYSQAPNRSFAFHSDTAFIDDLGQANSSLRADRFSLSNGASIGQIVWYGHYGNQNQGFDPEPPIAESFRIRLFSQVDSPFPIQQLPDELLYETTSDAVVRELTGWLVSPGRREYRYVFDLPSAFIAQPGIPYWLEVSQQGDLTSVFRWETSGPGEHARQLPADTPWVLVGTGQLAYELRIPEPITGSFVALVVLAGAMHRSSRLR